MRRVGRRKQRGLTCSTCRARKASVCRHQKSYNDCINPRVPQIRCEGSQPRCRTCEAFGDECRYENVPPMSRILDMARRLQEAEQQIEELRSQSAAKSRSTQSPSVCSCTAGSSIGPPIPAGPSPASHCASSPIDFAASAASTESVIQFADWRNPVSSRGAGASMHADPYDSPDASIKELPTDLSLDENGRICYYGPTSAVHEALGGESPRQTAPANAGILTQSQTQSLLAAKAKESRKWEGFAIGSATSQTDIPRQVITKLLQLHWTWIGPMFMWVYRPAFMGMLA